MATEINTVARPYAKAAFEFAKEDNAIKAWSVFLSAAAMVVVDPQVQALLNDPAVAPQKRADFFSAILQKYMVQTHGNFIQILSEEGRLAVLPEIAELFALYQADYEKTIDVLAISFRSITTEQKDAIAQQLEKRLGRRVVVNTQIDPTLLGGLIIRAGDLVIDGSVKARLQKLREQLIA